MEIAIIKYEIPKRFCNTTGKIRIVKLTEDYISIEQEMYSNSDSEGNALQYPETKWFPVNVIEGSKDYKIE